MDMFPQKAAGNSDDQQDDLQFRRIFRGQADVLSQVMVRRHHAARSPAEDGPADIDEDGKAVHDFDDDRAAKDDDRHGNEHAEHEQAPMIIGDADDAQDVVQTHKGVSHDDSPHSCPQGILGFDMDIFFLVIGADELDADDDQENGANRLQERNLEEPGNDEGHDETQADGPGRPIEDSPFLQMLRQVLGGHTDDDGIISTQSQIDEHHLQDHGNIKNKSRFKSFQGKASLTKLSPLL